MRLKTRRKVPNGHKLTVYKFLSSSEGKSEGRLSKNTNFIVCLFPQNFSKRPFLFKDCFIFPKYRYKANVEPDERFVNTKVEHQDATSEGRKPFFPMFLPPIGQKGPKKQ